MSAPPPSGLLVGPPQGVGRGAQPTRTCTAWRPAAASRHFGLHLSVSDSAIRAGGARPGYEAITAVTTMAASRPLPRVPTAVSGREGRSSGSSLRVSGRCSAPPPPPLLLPAPGLSSSFCRATSGAVPGRKGRGTRGSGKWNEISDKLECSAVLFGPYAPCIVFCLCVKIRSYGSLLPSNKCLPTKTKKGCSLAAVLFLLLLLLSCYRNAHTLL